MYIAKADERTEDSFRIEQSAVLLDLLSVDLFTSVLIVLCSALRVFH